MNRRALNGLLVLSFLGFSGVATALEIQAYNAAHADWCPTCISQSRALEQLKAAGQLQGMTVLVADYDKEKDLKRQHKVRSQSVLVIFKGTTEVARSAGETQPEALTRSLAKAL